VLDKGIRILVLLLILLGIISFAFALTKEEKLNLLEERLLKEEISEKTYLELKKKYEEGKTEVSVPASASGNNLLTNPGFEETTKKPDLPDGWMKDPWNTAGGKPTWKLDTTVAHSGKNSAYIKCPAKSVGTWEQEVKIDPSKSYVLRVWVKGRNMSPNCHVICDRATRDRKRPLVSIYDTTRSATFDWTQITLDRVKPQPNTEGVLVNFVNRGPGEVWFDDAVLVEETTSVSAKPTAEPKAGEQVLKNPGFEEIVDNLPAHWPTSNWAGVPMKFSIDSEVAHTGKYSARLDAELKARGVFYQDIPVKGGEVYTLRVWAKSKNLTGGAAIACDFAPVGAKPRYYLPLQKELGGTRDWTQVIMPDIVVPQGATKASISLIHSRGTLWFDDVELIRGALVSKGPCRYLPLNQKAVPDPGENSFLYYASDYHQHEIYASPDIPTMIAFGQSSRLSKDKPEPEIRLILDLPEGFQVHGGRFAGKSYTGKDIEDPSDIEIEGKNYKRFRINCVYRKKQSRTSVTEFIVSTTIKAPQALKAYYATEIDGKLYHQREIPLHIISIPEVGSPKKIVTWFWSLWGTLDDYPDATVFNRIGFSIPDPEYFQRVLKSQALRQAGGIEFLRFTVKEGEFEDKDAQSINLDGEVQGKFACPTYRGKNYQALIQKGRRAIDLGVYEHAFDPERNDGKFVCFCPRCIGQFKEYLKTHSSLPYKDPKEFIRQWGKYPEYHRLWVRFKVEKANERHKDYREAMIRHMKEKGLDPGRFKLWFAAGDWCFKGTNPNPDNTDYWLFKAVEGSLEDPLILGDIVDYFAPMMYIDFAPDYRMKADMLEIPERLASIYEYSKGKVKVYPTLSVGWPYVNWGANIEPNGMMKYQILEAFAGGAKGISIYNGALCFDALDMKHFAEAMQQVLSVEDIIVEGKPISKERIRDLNKQTFVKGIESKDGAVILVSEYSDSRKEAKVEYRIKESAEVVDLSTGKSIAKVTPTNSTFKVALDKDRARLFYVGRKQLKR